jgi:hypothetical protein
MWRKVGREVAKLLAGIIAATAAVDLLFVVISATPLQWVLPVPPVALYGPDPDTGYRHRADVSGLWLTEHRSLIRTSNLGLRDRKRDVEHDGTPRAVIIGDSFIEALQVDGSETATAVAEEILAREHPGTEVVNLGVAGARPAVEVARLQSEGIRLHADAAVVMLYVDNFLSLTTTDDSEFTGYRADADGEYRLSYGFRDSSGYRFRTSMAGRIYYWLLDHTQVARIINARKNSGFLAEWIEPAAAPAQRMQPGFSCGSALLDGQLALWRDGTPSQPNALANAFIRDLAAIRQSRNIPIFVAAWDIEARCPSLADKRTALIAAMRARIEDAGLQFVDLDQRIVEKVGPAGVAKLHGFGASFGTGHLNVEGNRVYGEIFADVLRPALFTQP